ncbi:MAG: response regulator transcription factor [Myxococcales bacterium]
MTATLLAVDDSKTMRKVIEITFAGENYRMVMADSPGDAMSKLRSEKPSIALVDALLGGTSGYDLCQQIKTEAPNVGVIVLSSKQHPYDRVKGGSVGADDFLDKPYDTQALIDKVAALTQKLASGAAARPAAAAPAPTRAVAPAAAAQHAPPQQTSGQGAATTGAQAASSTKPHATTMSFANPGAGAAPRVGSAASTGTAAGRPPAISVPSAQPVQPTAARPGVAPAPAAPAAAAHAAHAAPAPAQSPAAAPAAHAAQTAASAATAQPITALVDGSMESKLGALGLTKDQIAGVLALSREVVEQVVW